MTSPSTLLPRIESTLRSIAAEVTAEYAELDPEAVVLGEYLADYTRGGKRIRSQFLAAGWAWGAEARRGNSATSTSGEDAPEPVVLAACALELFHAGALAHDDIIDASDTRRGAPSAHRAFEAHHAARGWMGNGARFGEHAAILFGDLLFALSDESFLEACALVPVDAARRARHEFRRMRVEVAAGQHLDLVAEVAWNTADPARRIEQALRVATAKSARYSVEAPLALGALLAGASEDAVTAMRRIGLPLGLAFQLRDDLLGVAGDESVTGKPAGDDLREGKRTVLVAEHESRIPPGEREELESLLGRADLSADQVRHLVARMRESGAVDAVEARIERFLAEALAALDSAAVPGPVAAPLRALAERTARREL